MPQTRQRPLRTIRATLDLAADIQSLAVNAANGTSLLTFARGFTIVKAKVYGFVYLVDGEDAVLEFHLRDNELTNALSEALLELNGPDEPEQLAEVEISERARYLSVLGLVPGPRGSAAEHAGDLLCPIELEVSRALRIAEGHAVTLGIYNHGPQAVGANALGKIRVELIGRWDDS